MFFKKVFDVAFELHFPTVVADDPSEEFAEGEDDDVEGSSDEHEVVHTTVCCMEETTLAAFATQLEQYKARIVADLGYADPDMEIVIVSVEDVSGSSNITMFPPNKQH